jgi:glutamine synthetase
MRRSLHPGAPLSADPATLTEAERDLAGAVRLPASLDAALEALAADPVLTTALGPLRSAAYLAVKRSEAAHFATRDTAYECRQHWMRLLRAAS